MALADKALQATPGDPVILDTRGYVLFKMGRYGESLVDLERSVNSLPDRPGLHETLAAIYAWLEKKEMATRHWRLVAAGQEGAGTPSASISTPLSALKDRGLRPKAVRVIHDFGPMAAAAVPTLIAVLREPAGSDADLAFRQDVQLAAWEQSDGRPRRRFLNSCGRWMPRNWKSASAPVLRTRLHRSGR